MNSNSRFLPVFFVAAVVGLAVAIIVVSLLASRSQWDRETAIAAARYDGRLLLAQLGAYPTGGRAYIGLQKKAPRNLR